MSTNDIFHYRGFKLTRKENRFYVQFLSLEAQNLCAEIGVFRKYNFDETFSLQANCTLDDIKRWIDLSYLVFLGLPYEHLWTDEERLVAIGKLTGLVHSRPGVMSYTIQVNDVVMTLPYKQIVASKILMLADDKDRAPMNVRKFDLVAMDYIPENPDHYHMAMVDALHRYDHSDIVDLSRHTKFIIVIHGFAKKHSV